MLEATNLECVRGDRRLFAGVGFRLDAGELLHVSGHNGAGKTTLLRTLVGLTHAVAGEIRWASSARITGPSCATWGTATASRKS